MTKAPDPVISAYSISTHILTKRMTVTLWWTITRVRHFNSHPHEEDDGTMSLLAQIRDISTHILTKRMTT